MLRTRTQEHALDLVILYNNLRAGQRAKELCDRVAAQLEAAYELRLHCWNFSMLSDPVAARVVTIQVMSAPCLIVAFNGNDGLAGQVEAFLKQCARTMRAAGTALVAQLHGIPGGKEELSPSYRCLQQIAANAEIPFFSEVIEREAGDPSQKIIPFPNQPSPNRKRGHYAKTEETATIG